MITRRKFIASVTAIGLLSVMPSPVRAWAKNLYLPKGARIEGPNGELLAVANRNLWRFANQNVEDFDWHKMPKPQPGDFIQGEFAYALERARKRLGLLS